MIDLNPAIFITMCYARLYVRNAKLLVSISSPELCVIVFPLSFPLSCCQSMQKVVTLLMLHSIPSRAIFFYFSCFPSFPSFFPSLSFYFPFSFSSFSPLPLHFLLKNNAIPVSEVILPTNAATTIRYLNVLAGIHRTSMTRYYN